MTDKLARIRRQARLMFNDAEREPWEQAWARVFEALPDYCEDVNELRIEMLQAAINGLSVEEGEALVRARALAVPPCPVLPSIPPCPV